LGATIQFINIEYAWSRNLQTQHLPRAIPVYNVDGTPNKTGYIMEVVDLIFKYKDHSESFSFHITSIGWTTIILGHGWLMSHNPDIDWSTGEDIMT